QPSTPDEILKAGDQFWPLRAFRELDDALLRLRVNEPEIGTIVIRTEGDRDAVLAIDRTLVAHQAHWLVREIIAFMKRTLKRLDVEARAAFSPDAMTGLEANLRFAGPETMETKIFGRLTAWQNWIFQRPNAVGDKGALKVYGQQGRPEFDWKRT